MNDDVALVMRSLPHFAVTIMFSKAERYPTVNQTARYFNVQCTVLHSKGQFTYEGRDICFEVKAFERFRSQLDAIRMGTGSAAELAEAGTMLTFGLEVQGRHTHFSARISEAQAEHDKTVLSAGFNVDYDMFVNKLFEDLTEFIHRIRQVEPRPV